MFRLQEPQVDSLLLPQIASDDHPNIPFHSADWNFVGESL